MPKINMNIPLVIGLIIAALLSPSAAIVVGILLFIGSFLFSLWQEVQELNSDLN